METCSQCHEYAPDSSCADPYVVLCTLHAAALAMLEALETVAESESMGIEKIRHSSACGTARYSNLPCYVEEKVAEKPCVLMRVRSALRLTRGRKE